MRPRRQPGPGSQRKGSVAAGDLLASALRAHGGEERWARVREVVLHARSGGLALATKGRARDVRAYTARISARAPRVVFVDWPAPGQRGAFEPERVRIESGDGEVLAERHRPWEAFRGARTLRWDRLHLLYFAGYALWGYLNQPFLLARPDVHARELAPARERGEPRRRLAVTFPPGLPVHSREQVFHFDQRGLIRRNDYTAEVFGRWARGRHYSDGHREFGGLVFPTRRRVYPGQSPLPFPTLVRIDIAGVDVVSAAPGP
jgi:hypothetical protein